LQNNITISPNPSNDFLNLDLNIDGEIDFEAIISDPLGKHISTVKISNKSTLININDFSSGTYFLQIKSRKGELLGVKKFVVN